jgi:hypothetical protein
MISVHHTAIAVRQKRHVHLILPALLILFAAPLSADDSERSDAYDAMLSCSAFHTIESSKLQGDAAEAQRAMAYDFAEVAAPLAPDGKESTADADLKTMLESHRQKLDTGDVRAMAEDWTALESACAELYPVRKAIGKAELSASQKPD